MNETMFAAAVWMAHKRLTAGVVPVLDRRLCDDIDSQAAAGTAFERTWRTVPPALSAPLPATAEVGPGIAATP